MTRFEIEQTLKKEKSYLAEEFHVKKIGLFGSYVRGEQDNESDIDLLVEFHQPVGLEFVGLKIYLEERLGKSVDLVTEKALKPSIKNEVLNEVQYQ